MKPLRVTFLGTGTSTGVPVPTCTCPVCASEDPHDARLRPSVRLEWTGASVLIDTSTDLRQQALRYEINRIDAVLYTHAHADHVLGLDELRLFNWRQKAPIPAFGSARTLDAVRRTFWYVFDDDPGESTRPALDLVPVDAAFELRGRKIVPIPVDHGRLPILGWRVGRFAYLTDVSRIPASSYPLLEDLDVLVLNALRSRPHPTHFTVAAAVIEAQRIGARRTLLTHMSHELPHAETCTRLPRGVELAYDGLVLELE